MENLNNKELQEHEDFTRTLWEATEDCVPKVTRKISRSETPRW